LWLDKFALTILIIGFTLALTGIVIAGDIPFLNVDEIHSSGLGYSLLDVGLGTCIVFLIVDKLLRQEKTKPWKDVGENITQLIQMELDGVASDLITTLGLKTLRCQPTGSEASTMDRTIEKLSCVPNQKLSDFKKDLDLLVNSEPDFIENNLFRLPTE
jgi:hypothetical protein